MALTSPPLQSTTSPKHKISKALIAGVSAAAAVVLIAIIAFIIWWRRRRNRSRQSLVPASTSNERSSSIDEGKIRDIYVPPSQSTPSPRPYTTGESSAPTDNSSFSGPMIAPSGPSFPPEIQSEQYSGRGNIPMRQTTTLASLEKRTVMARQGPDTASNSNSGFYTSAISPTINAMSSSNQLYDATKAPLNQGIPATMNMQSPSNWYYEPAKVPLKQGSEKDGG